MKTNVKIKKSNKQIKNEKTNEKNTTKVKIKNKLKPGQQTNQR